MKNKFMALVLFLILGYNSIVPLFANNIKIRKINTTRSVNLCMVQDKDGLFWIGTEGGGLFCYDGNEIQRIKINEKEKSFEIVPSVFVDSKGLIWGLVLSQGLFSYDKDTGFWKNYTSEEKNPNSLTSNEINKSSNLIVEDKDGLIWIGTNEGLNSYDKKTNKFIRYKHSPGNANSLSNNKIWAVFVDKENLVWIGTENGLNCYNKRTNSVSCYKHVSNNINSLSNDHVNIIKEDKNGTLWIGTDGGLCSFNKQTKNFINCRHNPTDSNSLSFDEVTNIMIDRFNNLWICNRRGTGIDRYDSKTKTFTHFKYDPQNLNSISSNQILYSFEDTSGIIWLIDSFGWINKCIRKRDIFDNYYYDPEKPFSISSDNLAKLYEDKKGNIWIGTYKGGMCLYTKDDKFENFTHNSNPFSLPGISVYSILEASDSKLWLGVTFGFICLFDTNSKQIIKSFKNPYSNITPFYLTQDNNNPDILWFACSYAGGLFKFNTTTSNFTIYKHEHNDKSSISSEVTFNILQDGNVLWIATGGGGLCKFDKTTEKCIHYKHDPNDKNSISSNIVIESFIDSKGNFWITTEDGGLNKFDKQTGKFIHYGIERGFPSNSVRHILEDNDGHLWISTGYGIVKFDPKILKVIKNFTTTDGLFDNQFHKITCPLKDSKGNFWFPGFSFGFCKFNPEDANKIEPNYHIPTIVLSSFKSKEGMYNEGKIKKLTDVKLAWPDNSFEFTFIALDYVDPEKNQYAYKLDVFDKDWNYIGIKHFGKYTNIPPGEYTLRLKGSNNDGIWNEDGVSIKITITPPFWMTSWFKGVSGIVILFTIVGVILLIIRSLKKRALYMKDHALAEVTAQVVHDIRSPLAALNTALKHLQELPEQERILIRNATHRINDIANNILIKYKIKGKDTAETKEQKHLKAELVSSLLDHLISEKRVQMLDKSIELVLDFHKNTHSCFVNLEPGKFKRAISNLINNAFEAIELSGIIRVVLARQGNNLTIKIIDNGKGIPEDTLLKIKQGKISSTKKDGCGLGISNATQHIMSWGGSYDIESGIGKGTTFTINFPITKAPDWFQSTITLSPNTHIIVLDDDESIHSIWQTHFSEYIEKKLITLDHFYESAAFAEYCLATPTCPAKAKSEGGSHAKAGKNSRLEHDLFLVDYELINSKETGLDLIEQLDLKKQAILVTSRYEELEIRERIRKLEIKIIPKNFAPYVPISLLNGTINEEQPELIFIDDDKTLTEIWEMRAALTKKKIATFNRSEDFKKVMYCYNKDILIYIDSDLKEQIPGEIFAKFLYEHGFHNLYLATGYDKDRFGAMPWIKDIVTKEAPF